MKNEITICFDQTCSLCGRGVQFLKAHLPPDNVQYIPQQDPVVRSVLGLRDEDPVTDIMVITHDDRVLSGADALRYLGDRIGWLRPLSLLSRVLGVRNAVDWGYRVMARNRHRLGCRLPRWSRPWWGATLPCLAAMLVKPLVPAWLFMWVLSYGLLLSLKIVTLIGMREISSGWEKIAYLFLWPGLDATAFMNRPLDTSVVTLRDYLRGAVLLAVGVGLLVLWPGESASSVFNLGILLIGTVLVLHFGGFELIAQAWRARGRRVRPIMNRPLRSTGLSEFWGHRWNLAFRDFSHPYVFAPLQKSVGTRWALLCVFGVSGLLHEAVISLPAGGGYGLPTLYFMIQAGGCLLERYAIRRRRLGRAVTFLFLLGPLPLLIHQPFVRNVLLPLIDVLAAL